MATLFWVGGTGTYDGTTNHFATTSGGVASVAAPTSSDTVTFDTLSNATAYTVTISATLTCSDLTIGNPLAGVITFAGFSNINCFGNISMPTGGTWTWAGVLTMKATSGTKTITSNGVTFTGVLTLNGVGGTFQLADNFILSSSNGSFTNTNGTFDANTKTFTSAGQNFTVAGNTITFYNLTIAPTSLLKNHSFSLQTDITISNLFTTTMGATVTNRLFISPGATGVARTITSASNALTNVDFQEITAAGAASWNLSAIAGLSGDCGGNTGITFTTPTTQHFTNVNGGSWSTVANWTSRVPLPQDTVAIDTAFGASKTITNDMPRAGGDVDFSSATWTTALTYTQGISSMFCGSLNFKSGITQSSNGQLTFGGHGSSTLTTNGTTLERPILVDNGSGTLTLGDALTIGVTRTFAIGGGTFVTGGFAISTGNFALSTVFSGATRTITLTGTDTWSLTASSGNPWDVNSNSGTGTLVINPNSSTIKITNTGATGLTFSGGGKTYANIWWSRGASAASNTMVGNNTFVDFKDDGTAAHSLIFTTNSTTTVQTFTVSGNGAGNEITINSTTTGTHTLTAPTRSNASPVSCDYLNIQHSIATQSNTWYAGTHSTNNQATATAGSGWIFTAPVTIITTGNMLLVM